MDHRSRENLIDVQERRAVSGMECREDMDTGEIILEGYAATFEPYDCYGGPERGGWVEQLTRSAFNRTLAEQPDVMLLINHEGLPIARTKAGNLALGTDQHGLRMIARLDPTDPDVQRLAPKMKPQPNGRSIMDEMSFSFRVKDHVWDMDHTHRTITELSLQKGDVSVVNYGMNPGTRAILSSVDALAAASQRELVEVRSMSRAHIGQAMDNLMRAWRAAKEEDEGEDDVDSEGDGEGRQKGQFGGKKAPPFKKGQKPGSAGSDTPDDEDDNGNGRKYREYPIRADVCPGGDMCPGENCPDHGARGDRKPYRDQRGIWVNFDGSHLLYDGMCVTCAGERAKTPSKYAGISNFADPGYLDSSGKQAKGGNGQKRYPIDAKHVQAAWSYINMPKNQKGYTASQLAAIKSKIKAAMKRFGHQVSEEKGQRDLGESVEMPVGSGKIIGTRKPRATEDQTIDKISHVEVARKFGGGTTLVAVLDDGSRVPLPSFRQSGEFYSSPTPAYPRRQRTTDNSMGNTGGSMQEYDWSPSEHLVTDDPHEQPYTVDDLGSRDPGELHGGAAPQPSSEVGTAFRDKFGDSAVGVSLDDQFDNTGTGLDPKDFDDDVDATGAFDDPEVDTPAVGTDEAAVAKTIGRSIGAGEAPSDPDGDSDEYEPDDDEDAVDETVGSEPWNPRSISGQLAVLRRNAELPDMPSVDEAFEYLRSLA